ncbi:MAG: hypothetical protein R2774_14030 [Saprospiraceae bacterium]
MYRNIILTVSILVFYVFLSKLDGQVIDTIKQDLDFNQVEVVKAFEANLADANIIHVNAPQPVVKPYNPKYNYDITIVPLPLKYPDPQIKPLAMNPDGPFKVRNGFLDASYSFLINPRIHTGYNVIKKDEYTLGGTFFFEALDNTKNSDLQSYTDGSLDLFGTKLMKENLELFASIGGEYRGRKLYFVHNPIDTTLDGNRTLIHANGKLGLRSVEFSDGVLGYEASLILGNTVSKNTDVKESSLQLVGSLWYPVSSAFRLNFDGLYQLVTQNIDGGRESQIWNFIPMIKSNFGRFYFNVGVDLLGADSKTFIFPNVMVDYPLLGQTIQIFGGVKQSHFLNSLQGLSTYNPYFSPLNSDFKTSVSQSFFGGLRGEYNFIHYEAQIGVKSVKNMAMFLNDDADKRFFNIVYDDVNVVYIAGNLNFNFSETMSIGGKIQQNIYSTDIQDHAWHMPLTELSATYNWRLLDRKLDFSSEINFATPSKYLIDQTTIDNTNTKVDLNVQLKYHFSDRISMYVKGQNLLNNRFERYFGYPTVGLNAGAGIRVIF